MLRNRIKIAIRVFKWQHLLVCTYRLIITSLLYRVERIKYLQFSQLLIICCRRRICNNISLWLLLFSRRCYSAFGKRVDPSYIISQHVTYSVEVEQSDQATSVESRTIFHGRIIHERLIKYFYSRGNCALKCWSHLNRNYIFLIIDYNRLSACSSSFVISTEIHAQ